MARYPAAHKRQTRERILAEAAEGFRERGLGGLSVPEVMKRAGLTHGGFYAHFPSKGALVAETLAHAFAWARERLAERAGSQPGASRLARLVGAYLTPEHRDHPGQGCTVAALGSEMARLSPELRRLLGPEIEAWIDDYARAGAGDRKTAITVVAALVGAMQIARIAPGEAASREVLEAVREVLCSRLASSPVSP